MPRIELLAANEFSSIITIFFIAISVIGAILNAVNNSKEQAKRAERPRPKKSSVRREIEEFLEQQGGGRKPAREAVDDLEILEEPPRRLTPAPAPRPPKQRPVSKAASAKADRKVAPANRPPQTAASSRPKTTSASEKSPRPVSSGTLGAGLREHVAATMAERVGARAEKDLPHLQSHVAVSVTPESTIPTYGVSGKSSSSSAPTKSLITMLRDPGAVRNAVILAEIMMRPRALR